jgi:hypothetical protein
MYVYISSLNVDAHNVFMLEDLGFCLYFQIEIPKAHSLMHGMVETLVPHCSSRRGETNLNMRVASTLLKLLVRGKGRNTFAGWGGGRWRTTNA